MAIAKVFSDVIFHFCRDSEAREAGKATSRAMSCASAFSCLHSSKGRLQAAFQLQLWLDAPSLASLY